MATITSAANPLLKEIRRAIARGEATEDGYWVAETFHLLQEARRSGCEVRAVLVAESQAGRVSDPEAILVPDELLRRVAGTETSPGVIALVKPAEPASRPVGVPLVIVLDELQDPGNVGTIVRAAEAFGATSAIFLKGTASPCNSKTLRASAGSLFRLPVQRALEPAAAMEALRYVERFAAVPGGGLPVTEARLTGPCALIVGNEARGVSGALREHATEISIPTTRVESLNAAVAAGILLYEAHRQRMLAT